MSNRWYPKNPKVLQRVGGNGGKEYAKSVTKCDILSPSTLRNLRDQPLRKIFKHPIFGTCRLGLLLLALSLHLPFTLWCRLIQYILFNVYLNSEGELWPPRRFRGSLQNIFKHLTIDSKSKMHNLASVSRPHLTFPVYQDSQWSHYGVVLYQNYGINIHQWSIYYHLRGVSPRGLVFHHHNDNTF